MSKTWYPVINYELCTECGTCTDKCSHGVYDEEKAPRPVVVYPEGCIEGCHGCGNLCPGGAIEYFGNIADGATETCGCGCGCEDDCGCDDTGETNDCGCRGGCSCDGGK